MILSHPQELFVRLSGTTICKGLGYFVKMCKTFQLSPHPPASVFILHTNLANWIACKKQKPLHKPFEPRTPVDMWIANGKRATRAKHASNRSNGCMNAINDIAE